MKTIPRLEDKHPPYDEDSRKDVELSLSIPPLRSKAAELRAKLSDADGTNNNRIRALAGQPLLPDASSIEEELNSILRLIQDTQDARSLLNGKLQREKALASRLVCEECRPEATRLGQRFAKAFVELHSAHKEYHKYLEAIEGTGASIGSLGRVWPSALGHFADLSSGYSYAFKDFLEAGYLSRSDMPKELQP